MSNFTDAYPDSPGLERTLQQVRDQEEQRHMDLVHLLEEPAGRRVFSWLLLDVCGLLNSGCAPENVTAFNQGRRHVALQLLARLAEAQPDGLGHLLVTHEAPLSGGNQ